LAAGDLNANGQPSTANNQFIKSSSADDYDWRKTDSYTNQNNPVAAWMWNSGSGTKTVNDPCPDGFRVPTSADWTALLGSPSGSRWTVTYPTSGGSTYTWFKLTGAKYYDTPSWSGGTATKGGLALVEGNQSTYTKANTLFFLPAAGRRKYNTAIVIEVGERGYYGSSTPEGKVNTSNSLYIAGNSVNPAYSVYRANGVSVRCIEE
jgi:uncharacterized protein (TIGR02145 family)